MKGRRIDYCEVELAWIEAHKELPRAEAYQRFVALFGRTDVTKAAYAALCKRKGWLTGRTGCFAPGQEPANKGKTMPYDPNRARTQFKKGGLPHNTLFLGHERLSKDGYVEVSVAETNPHTGYERRYVQKHRWLWVSANGPVPAGMVLKSIDGNRQNTDPSNWVPIPIDILPRLNGRFGCGYDAAPADLKPTIFATTRLEHRARELRKGRKP